MARVAVRALVGGRRAWASARVRGATRGLLHSLVLPLVGLRRIFHLETAKDPGLGQLTGGRRAWSRQRFGAWLRALPEPAVTRFRRRSAPRPQRGPGRGGVIRVSLDEHAVPRWTRKFRIPKGYHTTRNKHMKVEKLFTGFDVRGRQFLRLWATPGNVESTRSPAAWSSGSAGRAAAPASGSSWMPERPSRMRRWRRCCETRRGSPS